MDTGGPQVTVVMLSSQVSNIILLPFSSLPVRLCIEIKETMHQVSKLSASAAQVTCNISGYSSWGQISIKDTF